MARANWMVRKSASGSSLIEASLALVLLLGTAYMVCVQDTLALTQAAYDARLSVANTFLSNETSRVRASFDPEDPTAYLNKYPLTPGQSVTEKDVALGGERAVAAGRCPFQADVVRTFVSKRTGKGGLVYNEYRVDVLIPRLKGRTMETETLTRSINRMFRVKTGA